MGAAPQSIGPYKILQPLGKGGMGVVYKAVHAESGAPAALKTVSVPHQAEVASIRREIHALARIRHPGVVRILDEGLHEGVPWYAMELLEGTTLKQYALLLGRMAARAAGSSDAKPTPTPPEGSDPPEIPANVHDATVIGVKRIPADATRPAGGGALAPILCVPRLRAACVPAMGRSSIAILLDNVLVLTGAKNLVLADFGVVRARGQSSREEPGAGGGHVVGPHYMSPSAGAVRGRARPHRSRILYELVTAAEGGSRSRSWSRTSRRRLRLRRGRVLRRASVGPRGAHHAAPGEALRRAASVMRTRWPRLSGRSSGRRPRSPAASPRLPLPSGSRAARRRSTRSFRTSTSPAGRRRALAHRQRAGSARRGSVTEPVGEAQERFSIRRASASSVSSRRLLERGSGSPLEAFRKPLQSIADRCREGGRDVTDRLLGKRGKVLAVYETSLAGLPGQDAYLEPSELPPDAARQRLFQSMAETLYAFSDGRPAVIVLDDLQWADDLTSGLLAYMVKGKHLSRMPVCIVGTYRTEEAGEGLAPLLADESVTEVRLGRLGDSAVGEMVSDMLALTPAPPDFAQFLSQHSEGNPFFVAEYLRTAVALGILRRERSGWRLAESRDGFSSGVSYGSLPLPGSLRDLVARRLESLSPGARRVAEVASLLGRGVEGALLAGVARIPEKELMEAVEELIARQVMEDVSGGMSQFTHDKLREVSYERIDPALRRELHLRAAEALSVPPIADAHLAELGHHWEQAGDEGQARVYYLKAARRSVATYANKEAERLFRAYLGLCKRPTPESVQARNELARDVLAVTGRNRDAIEEFDLAYEEAGELHDLRGQAQTLRGLSTVHREIGHPVEAQAYAERSLAIFAELGDRGEQGYSLLVLAAAHKAQGHLDQAKSFFERSLSIHRDRGDRRLEAITLSNIAVIEREHGRLAEAETLQQLALTIHREVGNRRSEGITMDNLAAIYADRGELDAARRLLDEATVVLRDVGDRRNGAVTLGHLAHVMHLCGKTTQSLTMFEETMVILKEIGDRTTEAETRSAMAS
ncbi:MAG: tetratricopeptide repeat protein, partial [Acidobacteriota bacterium]